MEVQEYEQEHSFSGFLNPLAEPPGDLETKDFVFAPANLLLGDEFKPDFEATELVSTKFWFRGGWTCNCVVQTLPWVELDMWTHGLIKSNIDIFQLGYNGGGVAASAGTHDKGGCLDVAQRSPAHIKIWRKWGYTQQERIGVGTGPHAHGWPYGCPHLSWGAEMQENDWDRRDAGLVGSGMVQGPWPVLNYKKALERNKVSVLDEIKKAVKDALDDDNQVENFNVTGNPKNPKVSIVTSLAYLGKRVVGIQDASKKFATKDDVEALGVKVDALLTELRNTHPGA